MRRGHVALLSLASLGVHCGGSSTGSGAPTNTDATVSEAATADGAAVDDAAAVDEGRSDVVTEVTPPPPTLTCKPMGTARVLDLPPDVDGRAQTFGPYARIVRISQTLARVVATRAGSNATEVYTFDPTNPTGDVTRATLTIAPLQIHHTATALEVYGLRVGNAVDAGFDGQLVLVTIDDATGTTTELLLTVSGGIAPVRPSAYEPTMGRYLRFGPSDVYFTYTEETGSSGNPGYRLSVGRVTATSGPVVMRAIKTAGAHQFQGITAAGLVHTGSSILFLSGASGRGDNDDEVRNALVYTLPDDGSAPATWTSTHGFTDQLLATTPSGSGSHRFAFIDPPSIFGSPVSLEVNEVPESALMTMSAGFAVDPRLASEVTHTLGADAHFEGDQFLLFGPRQALWADAGSRTFRARGFAPPNPLGTATSTAQVGAVTFAEPPTASSAKLDVAYAMANPSSKYPLFYGAITCDAAPP